MFCLLPYYNLICNIKLSLESIGIGTVNINSLYKDFLSGKKEAESRLFKYLYVRFRLFATQRIWNEQDAEEIVQDTLMTIFNKCQKMEFESSFASWANNILEFKISNYLRTKTRRQKKKEDIISEKANQWLTSSTPEPDFKLKLLACLREIAKANIRYARILNLCYQGYKANEISEKLKITTKNFYMILSRSRSLMELCLETGRIK